MDLLGTRLTTDESFAYNTLIWVFRYLDFKDLLNCAKVCPIWEWIFKSELNWRNLPIYSCPQHIDELINAYGVKIKQLEILNAKHIPTDQFQSICSRALNLEQISVHGCHMSHLQILAASKQRLENIYAEINWGQLELDCLVNFQDLMHLEIVSHSTISMLPFITKLKKLKHLSLFAPCVETVWSDVVKIETLESLGLFTDLSCTWIGELFEEHFYIKKLKNLKKIQIANLPYFHEYDILDKIKLLPNIKELELSGISISRAGTSNFGKLLGDCRNIEKLTIEISRLAFYDSILDVALENTEILNGALALKDSLTYFCWILDSSGLAKSGKFFNRNKVVAFKCYGRSKTCPVKYMTLPKLLKTFQTQLSRTKVILVDPATRDNRINEKCCYKCDKIIMTAQDRMKRYQ